jgi:tagatose 1,6-diphosphate aldolase GatY/KbaY
MSMHALRPRLQNWFEKCLGQNRALMAFNVQNLVQLQGVVDASAQLNQPVIAQLSAKYAAREAKRNGLGDYVRLAGRGLVYLHLDHCTDDQLIHHCIRQGFDSVMFDGSGFSLAENIERTNRIAAWAHAAGCLVEAELGRIGGVEDDMGGEAEDGFSAADFARFCGAVEADLLAPAIGNAHGFYSDPSRVRIDQLPEARACLRAGQFLVLHGGTGLPDESLSAAIKAGVTKINISTHLKQRTQELLRDWTKKSLYDDIACEAFLAEGLKEFYAGYINRFTAC